MINKRLLIRNLLAHNSENSFFDKKRKINLATKEGKAKFLKHICALSNSNPENNSYLVIGVEDEDNDIKGVDFFDDSKIQNLVNAYLRPPPNISYENIPFPHLPDHLVVGLVTIRPSEGRTCALKKGIWKYSPGTTFFREGSISISSQFSKQLANDNRDDVASIEAHSQNNVALTLEGVFDFFEKHQDIDPSYKVFKEYFVVCWAGRKELHQEQVFFSRVDIALINEQVKLFYSDLDQVVIDLTEDHFRIREYVHLGMNENSDYFPLEEVDIEFRDNATYEIRTKLVFQPPRFEKKSLYHIYNSNLSLIRKLRNGTQLQPHEERDLSNLSASLLICYFNGFDDAIAKLEESKEFLKSYNSRVYQQYKDSLRILRKVKYN